MIVRTLTFNPLSENCYLLTEEEGLRTFIIDPGCSTLKEFADLKRVIDENHLIPDRILLTHTHFDHAMGAEQVENAYAISTYAHYLDEDLLVKMQHYLSFFGFEQKTKSVHLAGYVEDGDELRLGGTTIRVIHVPGHTHGGVAFYSPENKMIFTGDTLFCGSVGRTDFAEGSAVELSDSLRRLMALPPETVVYPGHGNTTTIAFEQKNNPFLQ